MTLTLFIIILTAITSITAFSNREVFYRLKFHPSSMSNGKELYRFASHALLHADWMHLLINMFVLYSFGTLVESMFGIMFGKKAMLFFGLLYVLGAICSSIPSFFKHRNNYAYSAVGASGAVSAILFASILIYPQGSISFMFLPIPIPAWLFGILYLVYSAYMSKKSVDNIGHDAHFWGAVFGIVFTAILNPALLADFIQNITNS